MARRNQGINIKVPRAKVIKALETKLAQLQKDKANQKTNEEKYQKAHDKWLKDVAKLALNAISKAEDLSASTRYNGEIYVNFNLPKGAIDLPKEPEKDFETMDDWQYRDNKKEIENVIRILKMCEDELISTATYSDITKYL